MTLVTSYKGYGEHPYGSLPYGSGTALGSSGLQFTSVIADTKDSEGVQFLSDISGTENAQGLQFFTTNLGLFCPGYGEVPYGSLPYGTAVCNASSMTQFESYIEAILANGVQFEANVEDVEAGQGVQFEALILDFLNNQGVQFQSQIADLLDSEGLQFLSIIADSLNNNGIQFESSIDFISPNGMQFSASIGKPNGFQFRVSLYNTTRLRILCEFTSRGAGVTTGPINAWGNNSGIGENWLANSQASGDFSAFNLNTDIVEQVFRSTATTGLQLRVDTEVTQGIFLDTLAILNHNMTTGAVINIQASSDPSFTTIDETIPVLSRTENIYYIAPALPLSSFRYWRIDIDDTSNQDGYIEIGTVVFGASQIFQGECMNQRVLKKPRHFADTVKTEGFTSVKNDRSLKNSITLDFSSLEFSKGNFQALDAIFKSARTSQKCLWIPTPSITNPSFTERFAVFAKLTELPEQAHEVMGENEGDYISLTVNLDESE